MNKIIFTFLLFFTIHSIAQLPVGSKAPDFTVTDINGNQHTLSSYLKAGKRVILEFSATGCGASWKYLRTESLQDFYNAYGLPGSNEVVVLFIEDGTVLSELQGADSLGFGNWEEGTPFPMVLNRGLHSLYAINLLPSFYWICSNGLINRVGMASAQLYQSLFNVYCDPLSGVPNYVRVLDNTNGFCDRTGGFKTKLKNYGSNNITTATLQLKENGVVIGTKKFTGDVRMFSVATVEFDPININPSATYTAELVNVNGVQNHNAIYSTANLPFNIAAHTGVNLQIKIHTYVCPNNMTWEITNSTGAIVASGGPYSPYPPGNCGGPNSNTVLAYNIALPDTKDCFNLSLMDLNGLGWKNYGYDGLQPINPGIEIFSNGSLIYSKLNVGNFGSLLKIENFLTTKDATGTTGPSTTKLNIFPNPSKGVIHINSESPVTVHVFNSIGQAVFYTENIDSNSPIDLSKLNTGIYIIKIVEKNNKETVQKLILNN